MNYPKLTLIVVLLSSTSFGAMEKDYPIRPVAFTDVEVEDGFWSARLETNAKVTIPYAFKKCEETGRISNFAVAGGLEEGRFEGIYFNDSDVYKVVEGAAYALANNRDPKLEEYVDGVIAKIAAAQEDDGYLYTARTLMRPDKMPPGGKERWSNIAAGHELYCVGHMYEAAVAYYQATGKRTLLDVALKNADLICEVFGPDGRKDPPGHQEIEIGLARLYRLTGKKKYLDMAKFFLDQRGRPEGHNLYGEYSQDHKPVVEQTRGVGHSVRAAYMYTGMADIAALTGDHGYVTAIDRIWHDVLYKKLYITGGIGAAGGHEGFGAEYFLPNLTAYCETCASIANAMWNHRMFLTSGDAKYMDVVERVIYNGFLSGISMEGDRFFYPNRLESVHGASRAAWFGCACCPSNVVRFVPSIPGYVYSHKDGQIYVDLFIGGTGTIQLADQTVKLTQNTDYPWNGKVRITVEPDSPAEFAVNVRIPGWARNEVVPSDLYHFLEDRDVKPVLKVNGAKAQPKMVKGHARIKRRWKKGDVIELDLPMSVRRVLAHENVKDDRGKVALQHGPIVYCVEGVDVKEGLVLPLILDDDRELTAKYERNLLNGLVTVSGKANIVRRRLDGTPEKTDEIVNFKAIPYYAWCHRDKGQMAVWLAREARAAKPMPAPTLARTSKVTASFGPDLDAMTDQLEPAHSNDHSNRRYHWWPHKGTAEWVQFDFKAPAEISQVSVYWFDDTGRGECRIPASWKLFYKSGDEWKPVENKTDYGIEKDKYNIVTFKQVKAEGIRLEIQSQEKWAGGIHELKIQ